MPQTSCTMKKFFRAALVLPLALFVVSCSESNDDGGDDKPVKLSPETKQEQQVYADDQQAPAPIKFTATAPWTATVSEVATKAEAGKIDWLELSAYSGKAGNVSLTMTLSPNYTGQDRKAEICIECAGTTIKITIEQKGTTESGKVPEDPDKPEQPYPKNRIRRIEKYRYYETDGQNPLDEYFDFTYDETGRVKTIKWFEYGDGGYSDVEKNATITYKEGNVSYESKHTEGTDISTSTGSIVLNENGWAVSGRSDFREMYEGSIDAWSYTYEFTYNAEGHLIETNTTEKDDNTNITENNLYKITWMNGNPMQALWKDSDSKLWVDDATYSTIENKTNIDLNWLLFLDTEVWDFATGDNVFSMLGYIGKRPQNMVKSVTDNGDGSYIESYTCTYEYQLDDKDRIDKIIEHDGSHSIEYRIFYAE